MSENITSSATSSFLSATGPIEYGFTNDYMFRVILQESRPTLEGLICSLLHLNPDEITAIEIKNPIQPGESIDEKEFVLNIEILLNNNTLLNLEMQVINEKNWPERSLSYLCRSFNQLSKGQDYTECMPAIHIGFVNFAPFPEAVEFYAIYKLLNVKNYYLYSDKFTLSVVDLSHIELATDEDKACGLYHWAKLFKSTTWEEIKMMAENNPAFNDASETLFILNSDSQTRARCQARKEFIIHQNALNRQIKESIAENEALRSEKEKLISEKEKLISEKEELISEIERLRAELEHRR